MRFCTPPILLLAAALACGCASSHRSGPAGKPVVGAAKPPPPIVTPDDMLLGKVAYYNSVGRFVVLTFPAGGMPQPEQTLFLYRGGLKVAQLLVTGPQTDNNIVADVVNGEAQTGDEVRDR
jgi:hypothetical protein